MQNPFVKLVNKTEEDPAQDHTNLIPSVELISTSEKEKRLNELKEWKRQVEAGMAMEHHSDDPEQLERINAEINKLEQALR